MRIFNSLLFLLLTLSMPVMAKNDKNNKNDDSVNFSITKDDFQELDVKPEYPGGEPALMEFIMHNLKYPASAANKGIQGRVEVSFYVEEDGSLTNFEVINRCNEHLKEEALRVIKAMPKWIPAQKDGHAVRSKYVLPVTFRLK